MLKLKEFILASENTEEFNLSNFPEEEDYVESDLQKKEIDDVQENLQKLIEDMNNTQKVQEAETTDMASKDELLEVVSSEVEGTDKVTDTEIQETVEDNDITAPYPKDYKKEEVLNPWEELNSKNKVIKKYVIQVDRENIRFVDSLDVDERNDFINDAVKLKIKHDKAASKTKKKIGLIVHFILIFLTAVIFAPVAIYIAHKSIIVTFENYKYSQDSFEKLYKEKLKPKTGYINHDKNQDKKQEKKHDKNSDKN